MTVINSNLPALDNRYTNVAVSSGADQDKAEAIGESITKFYNTALAADAQATLADKANNIDNPQNDVKVASDLATLHNLDLEFAKASGDSADVARLSAHADQLLGTTSNQLLADAGVAHQDSDFVYSGNSVAGGQQVDAHLKSDTQGNQGTSAYSISGNSVQVTNSSLGNSGKDWSIVNGSQTQAGGRYDAEDGRRLVQNMVAGGDRAGFTPRQNADAYTFLSTLSNVDRTADINKSPSLKQIWSTGSAAQVSGDPATSSDAFNALYRAFDTSAI